MCFRAKVPKLSSATTHFGLHDGLTWSAVLQSLYGSFWWLLMDCCRPVHSIDLYSPLMQSNLELIQKLQAHSRSCFHKVFWDPWKPIKWVAGPVWPRSSWCSLQGCLRTLDLGIAIYCLLLSVGCVVMWPTWFGQNHIGTCHCKTRWLQRGGDECQVSWHKKHFLSALFPTELLARYLDK